MIKKFNELSSVGFPKNCLIPFLVILVFTFIIFSPALNNGFTNWDDKEYVVDNTSIKSFSPTNLKKMATRVYVKNWHPVTMFSYALDYHFWKLDPRGYHLTSLIFHLGNTALVFIFMFLLTEKVGFPSLSCCSLGFIPCMLSPLHG